MRELGIFSRTYETRNLEETCKKMAEHGILHTQFNLSNAGLDTLPEHVEDEKLEWIRQVTENYQIHLDALSGTFNMIDPDIERRKAGCRQFRHDYIAGFSLLGGEPFEPQNQKVLCSVLERIKAAYPEKNVWCYSGYTFDTDLLSGRLCDYSITERMLNCIDFLVDGKFVEEKKDITLRFKGSSNQRIIDVKRSMAEGKIIRWSGDRIDD